MTTYNDGRWRYRTVVHLPNGQKKRISGTPDIDTETEAQRCEQDHVKRLLIDARNLDWGGCEVVFGNQEKLAAVVLSDVDFAKYSAAARRAGVSLSDFIRGACDSVIAYEAAQEFGDTPDEGPF